MTNIDFIYFLINKLFLQLQDNKQWEKLSHPLTMNQITTAAAEMIDAGFTTQKNSQGH